MKQLYKFSGNFKSKNSILYLFALLMLCSSFNNAELPKHGDKKSLSLSAKLDNGSKVVLKWPAPEMNVSNFVVQRSEDGVNYDDAAMIFAPEENVNTIKRYSYSDKIHSSGSEIIYYRIKIVDVKGKCTYSDIAVVELDLRDNQFASII